MSARVTIQSGISAGTSHRIRRRVARVGSDPQSDVCLPTSQVPAHALTLEFRDDECRVYNRCRDSVYIGTQVVAPDEVVTWPDTDILQLAGDIELLLDLDDTDDEHPERPGDDLPEADSQFDAAFDGAFDGAPDDAAAAESPDDAAVSSGSSRTRIQLGITLACVIGCVLLLMRDAKRAAAPDRAPAFAAIVSEAIEAGDTSPELLRRLQFAESLYVRGEQDAARVRFAALRDDLMAIRARLDAENRESELAILSLLESRLAKLR